jgi:hypothetical protein
MSSREPKRSPIAPKSNDGQAQSRQERDQQQYRRMVQRLEAFDAGDLDLGALVADLNTLLRALDEKPDREWADDYSSWSSELDIINSMALYRTETRRNAAPALSDEQIERARDIAGSLKRIVFSRMKPWTRS